MTEIRKAKLAELTPDAHNANQGTPRGLNLLDKSLSQYGAGRSILVDKAGRIIAGNKTAERAADLGIDDVLIVPTDGTQLVAVQRTDLDLTDPAGQARAVYYPWLVRQRQNHPQPAVAGKSGCHPDPIGYRKKTPAWPEGECENRI